MMDIKFNNKTPSDVGGGLATMPVLTHSEIRQNVQTVPARDGDLYETDMYRAMASWQMLFHMSSDTLSSDIRAMRSWLNGEGILEIKEGSSTPDSYYEVAQVQLTEDFRKSVDYGRINATFYVYPYEFLKSGDTVIEGDGTIENKAEKCKPLYHIEGSGSGTLTVNDHAMTFTVDSGNLNIDTRRMITYKDNDTSAESAVSGDYKGLYFEHGDNVVSITNGFDLEITPHWGYYI